MRFRCFSTAASKVTPRLVPLREYIDQALYHSRHGYFSKSIPPLIEHTNPLKFSSFTDRSAYEAAVASTYKRYNHGWMTPIELFSPYLSQAVANRILSAAPPSGQVHVVEIGPGRATLARDVLAHISRCHDSFMERLRYSLVEVSPTLSQLQQAVVKPWIASGVAKVICANAIDWFNEFVDEGSHIHVIATEVLDNLPHDVIRILPGGDVLQGYLQFEESDYLHGQSTPTLLWHAAVSSETAAAMHAFNIGFGSSSKNEPASIVTRVRSMLDKFANGGMDEYWVPTACHALLCAIVSAAPSASLTIADFTSFPGSLHGKLAPVVQSVRRGIAVVFDSVQDAPFGEVDIMFPTNFHNVADAHSTLLDSISKSPYHLSCRVVSQSEFFSQFSSTNGFAQSTCRDGYNPILQDFENTAFLLTDAENIPK